MVRRTALLIGAQTGELRGVDHDVQTMTTALERRGFQAVPCTGTQATRAGILAAYDRLIEQTQPGDACFVYYSGHGGLVRPPLGNPADPAAPPDPALASAPERQFIVPSDFEQTTDGDFRGITSIELSVRLAELTRRTDNVVAAFDCCHSAHMTRDRELRVRALLHTTGYEAIGEHLRAQVSRGLRLGIRHTEGNPDAVRLMACQLQQSAFEYTNAAGQDAGVLTESLALALAEAGDLPVTWSTVMDLVRRRVTLLVPGQWPAVEGPSGRLLFATEPGGALASLPVVPVGDGRVELRGAPLLNVQVGDEFAIMPALADRADAATKLGDAVVTGLDAMTAAATLRPAAALPADGLPAGARAHRTRSAAPELAVGLPDADGGSAAAREVVARLRTALEQAVLLRPAVPGEEVAVEVVLDAAGGIAVHDRIGPLHPPHTPDAEGLRRLIANLHRQARAAALRTLGNGNAAPGRFDDVTITWGRVAGGEPEPLELSGAVVYTGENVFVRVHNGTDELVHVSLIDIGLAARISVLTGSDTSGVRLEPGAEYCFGRDSYDNTVPGVPLSWPRSLEEGNARPETILAVITSGPLDVTMLEQGGVRGTDPAASPLEQMLDQIATGRTRDLARGVPRGIAYAVRGIDFTLSPARPPEPEAGPFLVDERPKPSVRLLAGGSDPDGVRVTARGAGRERHVAVRLDDLVVHRNRALFGADIRVDALVLTGGGPVDEPVYRVQTERFSNVRDGDRLPLDRLLMYHGPATDYLDLAIWVSRDDAGSLALNDLLRKEFTSHDVQVAGAQLTSLVLTAPHAAAAVAAVGAAAVVVNVAYKLLRGAVGHSIGLYRTSLLAREDFGIGGPPTSRLAQDFSFTYTVTDVS